MNDIPLPAEFAREQASRLLGRVVFEAHHVIRKPEADPVHDLRVSIRRFSHALAAFVPLLEARPVKKVRARLKRVMELTSEIRNRDIALEFLVRRKVGPRTVLARSLMLERDRATEKLVRDLERWIAKDSAAKWRRSLDLGEEAA